MLGKIVTLRLAKIAEVARDPKLAAEEREARIAKLRADADRRAQRAEEVLREVLDRPRTKDNDLALSTLARLESQLGRYAEADELLAR